MDITIYATAIDDVSSAGPDTIQVGLEGVDLSQVVSEVGVHDLLEYIGEEEIKIYLKDKTELETEGDE